MLVSDNMSEALAAAFIIKYSRLESIELREEPSRYQKSCSDAQHELQLPEGFYGHQKAHFIRRPLFALLPPVDA